MITERARLAIREGEAEAFEAIFPRIAPLFLRAKGCHGVKFERVIETPSTYVLVAEWTGRVRIGPH